MRRGWGRRAHALPMHDAGTGRADRATARRPTGNCRVRRAALLFLDLKEHTRRVSLRLLVPEWGPRSLLARLPQLVELGAEHPEPSLGDAEQLPVVRAVSSAGQCGRSRQRRIEEQRTETTDPGRAAPCP